MMIQVRQIQNSFFAVANYLIIGNNADYCWLIDVGQIDLIKEASEGRLIKGVFLTHSHCDHMFGINDLIAEYPDCKVYLSEAGVEVLASDKLNLSKYTGHTVTYEGDNLVTIAAKREIEIFPGDYMSAIPTPGHSPDSISFSIKNYLFTGDAFIPGEAVVTKLRSGNKELAKSSSELLLSIIDDETVLCPGHWGKSHLPF